MVSGRRQVLSLEQWNKHDLSMSNLADRYSKYGYNAMNFSKINHDADIIV